MVWACEQPVEAYAAAGRDVDVPRPDCPTCGAPMTFSSGYARYVRAHSEYQIWVRRARCKTCPSHALLPSFCLQGRRDTVEVIGPAVEASVVDGAGAGRVARTAGVDRTTARSWCRRHRQRARWALAVVSALVGRRAWKTGRSAEHVALVALRDLATASSLCGLGVWPTVSLLTGGSWLAPP